MIPAYPLQWPAGWRRSEDGFRIAGRFGRKRANGFGYQELTVSDALGRVVGELEKMGIRRDDLVVSTNLPVRLDGFPRSDARNPADPGAAVYWETRDGSRKVMAADQYLTVQDNLAAIAATLEALRAIERHGGAQILDRAFTGFTALPSASSAPRTWREVLGVTPADVTINDVQARYRQLCREHHPDRGGDAATMAAINVAWEQAKEALK